MHRALVSEGPQRAIDQPRIRRQQIFGAQAQFVHHARAKILNQHIGARNVVFEPADRIRVLQVYGDAALSMVHRLEGRGGTAPEWRAPASRIVAALGTFHLDHVSAQGRQDFACVRARDVLPDFDHLDSGEGQRCSGSIGSSVHVYHL